MGGGKGRGEVKIRVKKGNWKEIKRKKYFKSKLMYAYVSEKKCWLDI